MKASLGSILTAMELLGMSPQWTSVLFGPVVIQMFVTTNIAGSRCLPHIYSWWVLPGGLGGLLGILQVKKIHTGGSQATYHVGDRLNSAVTYWVSWSTHKTITLKTFLDGTYIPGHDWAYRSSSKSLLNFNSSTLELRQLINHLFHLFD